MNRMSRVNHVRNLAVLLVLLASGGLTLEVCGGEAAIPVVKGTQLFVDDQMIAAKAGVVRRAHGCEKLAEPVMMPQETWEQNGDDRRIYVYGTVLRDEASGQFRLWYNRGHQTLFATSDDGIHWQRPRLGICEVAGSTDNNVVLQLLHSPSVVYNPEPDESVDSYQMIGYGARDGRGYYAAHSPDGLHWTPYPKNPVLKTGDTCTLMFDERTGEYLAFYKQNHKLRGATRRLVYLSTSRDMQNWSKAKRVMAPDEIDDAQVKAEGGRNAQFYNMSAFPYADQYLGFVTHFHYMGPPARKGPLQSGDDGPIDVELVHSRDGRRWERCEDRSPVIPLGPSAYDAGCILGVSNGVAVVDDEMWAYYTAITTTHGGFVPEKVISIGRAAWRLDGFVSLDAEGSAGVVETVSFKPAGSKLSVNVEAAGGQCRVAVLDEAGTPLAGYSLEDCRPLSGDGVRQTVRWKTKDQLPTDRPIRLQFHLDHAKLYSYRIAE